MNTRLKQDEILITNFQIDGEKGVDTSLQVVENLEEYYAYITINKSFLKKFNKPYIFYDGRFGLDILSKFTLDNCVIEHLTDTPLYIFLYEDIETAIGNKIDLPGAIINKNFKIAATAKIQYETDVNTIHCYDFEYLRTFKNKNKLKKVYICSNAFIPDFLKNKYPEFDFLFFSPFLSEESQRAVDQKYSISRLKNIKIGEKFWCGNWRYTSHRHIIASYLVLQSSKLSWNFSGTFDKLNNNLWFDIRLWPNDKIERIDKGLHFLNKLVPLSINENITEIVDIEGSVIDLEKYPTIDGKAVNVSPWKSDLYINNNSISFCAIVTESKFAECVSSFSEKPLGPINHMMPFIIVGLPKTIELLKKIGFKTFDEFWDESYDQETNNEQRLLKILDLIDYIDSFSIDELTNLKMQMLPILVHNYNLLRTLPFDSPIYN